MSLPDDGLPVNIHLYADKSIASSFGTKRLYPVIARLSNLPREIRNSNGRGGQCLRNIWCVALSIILLTHLGIVFSCCREKFRIPLIYHLRIRPNSTRAVKALLFSPKRLVKQIFVLLIVAFPLDTSDGPNGLELSVRGYRPSCLYRPERLRLKSDQQ